MVNTDDKSNLIYKERARALADKVIAVHAVTPKVIEAFMEVPRHLFVPESYRDMAYEDVPLPIGQDQTISQPSLVLQMVDLLNLKGVENVLEIGTGSGYQAAILSKLAKHVHTIEIDDVLYENSKKLLKELGYKNISVHIGNGSVGLGEYSPYDAIVVSAGSPDIPVELVYQLKEGGRIVIPVGDIQNYQVLTFGIKFKGNLHTRRIGLVSFVPLHGKSGW